MNKKVLLLAILSVVNLTASADVEINETNFPDEIFRNWVSRYYGSDGVLTDEKVAGAERIYLAGLGIQSLKGIEYFTALTELTCYDNQLTVLDVSECTVLSELYCYNNMLATLNVSGCMALKKLDCNSNQLTALDVSECTALTTLDCYYNQLTALDISGCTALKMLNCGINQLTTLDVSKNTSLKELYCGSNQLTTLDVSKNTALTELSCNVNPLTTLDLSGCTALTTLRCHSCQFTTLDVSGCTALTGLDCTLNNQLTTLDLSNNTALTWLWCSYNNQLTTLDLSKNTALVTLVCENNQLTTLNVSGCTALTSINCSGNQLTTLDVSNTAVGTLICYKNQIKGTGMDTLVESLPIANRYGNMQVIWYENEQNEMTTEQVAVARAKGWVPFCLVNELWTEYDGVEPTAHVKINVQNFPDPNFRAWVNRNFGDDGVLTDAEVAGCTSINLRKRSIQSLKGIEYFTALTELDCTGNELTTLDVSGCTALTELICGYNAMATLNVSKNAALVKLDCTCNQLTTLDVSECTVLTTLLCSKNKLTELDVSECTALNVLSCSENLLTTLDVSKNAALTELGCISNQLTSLTGLKSKALTSLQCIWNQLTELDVSGCTELKSLECSRNQLIKLDISGCEALTELTCYLNQIKNAEMEALVEGLPIVSSGIMYVMLGQNEQNRMTIAQAAVAKLKGWLPYCYNDGIGWGEYGVFEVPQDTYRPFVEDGKVWKVGALGSGNRVQLVEYYYFDGDTTIYGNRCKQMMRLQYVSPDYPEYDVISQQPSPSYVGAWYEENKQVYKYDPTDDQFKLMYDFSDDVNETLEINNLSYVVGPKQTGGLEGFKGEYRDVWLWADGERIYSMPWLDGVGGLDRPTTSVYPGPVDPMWVLMSCAVDDEVIYLNDGYEDGATPEVMGARNRFDFTHTIKSQPKVPMRREAELTIYGEYNELLLDINLDPLVDAYLVRIYDESGKAVYEKVIYASSIVGLNIDILNYPKGRYTVTVENNYETFVGEFDTQTTGISDAERLNDHGGMRNDIIYNLQGQRIKSLQKGLNIVNGRKVYVK